MVSKYNIIVDCIRFSVTENVIYGTKINVLACLESELQFFFTNYYWRPSWNLILRPTESYLNNVAFSSVYGPDQQLKAKTGHIKVHTASYPAAPFLLCSHGISIMLKARRFAVPPSFTQVFLPLVNCYCMLYYNRSRVSMTLTNFINTFGCLYAPKFETLLANAFSPC